MPDDARLNPQALTPAAAAQLLSKAGCRPVTAEQVESDIVAGAPTNADGTLSLVAYCAWLSQERNRAD